jgi:hypothetical protein
VTLSELLANEELRQQEFPVARENLSPTPASSTAASCIGSDPPLRCQYAWRSETLLPAHHLHETRELARAY